MPMRPFPFTPLMKNAGDDDPKLETTSAGCVGPISTENFPHGEEVPMPITPEMPEFIMDNVGMLDVAKVRGEEVLR